MSSTIYLWPWIHCFLIHSGVPSGVPLYVPSTEGSELRILDHIRLTRNVVVCPVTFCVRRRLVQPCFVISLACGYYT